MEIKVKELTKVFRSPSGEEVRALKSVNLAIPANKIFTLLGPSGCGKTTLLRCIVGLEVPDAGEIVIGDTVVCSKARRIFVPPNKRGISMVFQTYAIWPHMTVFDNVAYPLQARKVPKEEIRRRVMETLRFVKLEGLENRPATALSGGQQQRVALARALVSEPKVILFDEPLSNLDAKLREETRKELRRFLTELGITALYVTHDRLEALTLSDLVAVMRNGVVVEVGAPLDIYFRPKHRFVADFIGKANFIEGTVESTKGDYVQVATPIGRIACRYVEDAVPWQKVTVCVRPEAIELGRPGQTPGKTNVFRGRVVSLLFVGENYEGEVRVGETVLAVKASPSSPLAEGDEVSVYLDPSQCHILKE
ncbi:ABC transporter ATP-binding protein [Candidatus Bipolaricaulota bacterium]|nr:ABC transporter ATP-binding protein [Candidatus Bipolaricaulota bacterium]